MSQWSTHERASDAADRMGSLEGWVNNAGIEIPASAHEVAEADLRRVLDVDLMGVAFGCATAVRRFLRRGRGSIVNVSSIQAVVGFVGSFAYQAAKGRGGGAYEAGGRGVRPPSDPLQQRASPERSTLR